MIFIDLNCMNRRKIASSLLSGVMAISGVGTMPVFMPTYIFAAEKKPKTSLKYKNQIIYGKVTGNSSGIVTAEKLQIKSNKTEDIKTSDLVPDVSNSQIVLNFKKSENKKAGIVRVDSEDEDKNKEVQEDIEVSDVARGDIIKISYGPKSEILSLTVIGKAQTTDNSKIKYKAEKIYSSNAVKKNKKITSDNKDEAGLLIKNGAKIKLSNYIVNKTSKTDKEQNDKKEEQKKKDSSSAYLTDSKIISENSVNSANGAELFLPESNTDKISYKLDVSKAEQIINENQANTKKHIKLDKTQKSSEETKNDDLIERNKTETEETDGKENDVQYGTESGISVVDGSLGIKKGKINTDTDNSEGVFSYGGSTIKISDSSVKTKGNNSPGLSTAGGGTLYSENTEVSVSGSHSPAIKSGSDGGHLLVTGGNYVSSGDDSPAVYSGSDVNIWNADLQTSGSGAAVIEANGSLILNDSSIYENHAGENAVITLQNSLDTDENNFGLLFSMSGGNLKYKSGTVFDILNADTDINLKNVNIKQNGTDNILLNLSEGSSCNFSAESQNINGSVIWNSDSHLKFELKNSSVFTGDFKKMSVSDKSSDKRKTDKEKTGTADVIVEKGSTWYVTGNSEVSSLTNKGTVVDKEGRKVSVVKSDGEEIIKGTSDYTVTVGEYSE